MYKVYMNGKESLHSYTEVEANKLADYLKKVFEDLTVEVKKA